MYCSCNPEGQSIQARYTLESRYLNCSVSWAYTWNWSLGAHKAGVYKLYMIFCHAHIEAGGHTDTNQLPGGFAWNELICICSSEPDDPDEHTDMHLQHEHRIYLAKLHMHIRCSKGICIHRSTPDDKQCILDCGWRLIRSFKIPISVRTRTQEHAP
jgi:hypothetical protein